MKAAAELGAEMAKRGITLVYGGGNGGIMGAIAKSVDSNGGKVRGIIPYAFFKGRHENNEGYHIQIENCEFVQTMHERKLRMCVLSDAFLALPGGVGTFEEMFESACWTSLGMYVFTFFFSFSFTFLSKFNFFINFVFV